MRNKKYEMKSLLVGNGITIQYGGVNYTNREIIKRLIRNVERGIFNKETYPVETLNVFKELYKKFPNLLAGEYDENAFLEYEKRNLKRVKDTYDQDVRIYDIHDPR